MPKQIRHDLGEYYRPDWLAERCLNQVGYGVAEKDLLQRSILDPGCGSGTFLVLAIKRAKEHANQQGIDPTETIKLITKNFDLATNRTAVSFCQKGGETNYPVDYHLRLLGR